MIKHRPMRARELNIGAVIVDAEFIAREYNNYPAYVSGEMLLCIESRAWGKLSTSRHNLDDDTDTLVAHLNLTEPT